jgi:hypothetical protein
MAPRLGPTAGALGCDPAGGSCKSVSGVDSRCAGAPDRIGDRCGWLDRIRLWQPSVREAIAVTPVGHFGHGFVPLLPVLVVLGVRLAEPGCPSR